VSSASPFAILAIALGGAALLALLEQLIADHRLAPAALAGRAAGTLRQPLSMPDTKDSWLYHGAPGLLLLGAMLALAMVPWAPTFRGLDFDTGAILYSAALAYVTPAVFMAGWGSGRPLQVVAGFRFIALMLAFEMPIVMAVTAVGAPAESLRPTAIVEAQHAIPLALSQPLAFVLFVPAIMAICFIAPFDLPTAEGELGGGAFASYTGLHAAVVALAQKVLLLGAAGMTVALFLGGWNGPLLPPALWMAIKTLAVAALMLFAGRLLPRARIDRLLPFAWKVAIPLAIVAIAWSGLVTLFFYR
jgi:NADH-quinone oxidoreductase subunit H